MTFKKLLVLDVNGLLMDTYFYKEPLPDESPDARVGSFYVYKRPFCEEFLQFCLENFTVGIWSSAREYNVNNLVDYVFGGTKEKLAFSWHQSDCTDLGLKSPDNQRKPLFLKELAKLWGRVKGDLPWKEGNYGPSNTLLVDDTPYKAILNPPNTAIFPRSYTARDRGDNFLGGALRSYLEGIRDAQSVQTYVESNPFGEPSITPASPLWSYVNEVMLKFLNNVSDNVTQIMPVEAVSNEGNKEEPKRCQGKWKHNSDSLQPVDEVTNEDNQAGKQKRWRDMKQKYQLANIHLQSNFSSAVVESQSSELQSSDCMFQPRKSVEQVHGCDADQQVLETANVGSQEMIDTSVCQTGCVCCHPSQSVEKQERPLKRERASQLASGISSLPSRLEDLSNAIQDRSILSTGIENYNGNDAGFVGSFEQEHQGTVESAKPAASMQEDFERIDKKQKENQAIHDENDRRFDKQGNIEGAFRRVEDAGVDAEFDRLHEGQQDVAAGILHSEGNDSEKFYISVGDDSLKSSEPSRLQAESNIEEPFRGRREMRGNRSVYASNNNYASQQLSYRHWHKHRQTPEELNMRHNSRYDSKRGRFGNGQGWKGEERYQQSGRGEMPYSRHFHERQHHFANKRHMDRQNSDKGYRNKTNCPRYSNQRWSSKPPAQCAWPSTHDVRSWDQSPAQPAWSSTHNGRSWDRSPAWPSTHNDRSWDQPSAQPACSSTHVSRSWDQPSAQPAWPSTHDSTSWDQSQQDWWQSSNVKTATNASFRGIDSNFLTSQRGSAAWVRKFDEYGQGQDRDLLGYSWQRGFDQGVCERTTPLPERVEQPNVNVHNPDSNLATVQAEAMGNGKTQRCDFASEGAGPSSQPHSGAFRQPYQGAEPASQPNWNAESFSQPYRGQHGGSRQAYHNVSAYQPYHNSQDRYRQGLPSGGFSTSRQSQEIRNL